MKKSTIIIIVVVALLAIWESAVITDSLPWTKTSAGNGLT